MGKIACRCNSSSISGATKNVSYHTPRRALGALGQLPNCRKAPGHLEQSPHCEYNRDCGERAYSLDPDRLSRMFSSSPVSKRLIQRTRRAFALCLSLCVLMASMPLPLGWKLNTSSQSAPFPCQERPCGCSSPEQCWSSCCCFPPAEREAWARERHITPPKYAVLASSSSAVLGDSSRPTTSCCAPQVKSTPAVRDCCGSDKLPTAPAAVSHTSHEAEVAVASCPVATAACSLCSEAEAPAVAHWQVVLALESVKCRGGSSEVSVLPWGILAPSNQPKLRVEPWCVPLLIGDLRHLSYSSAPEPPPPRV